MSQQFSAILITWKAFLLIIKVWKYFILILKKYRGNTVRADFADVSPSETLMTLLLKALLSMYHERKMSIGCKPSIQDS